MRLNLLEPADKARLRPIRDPLPWGWLVAGVATVVALWLGVRLAQLGKERTGLEAPLAASEASRLRLEAEIKLLRAERDLVTKQVQHSEAELEQLRATQKALSDQMKGEIAQGDVHLSQSGSRLQLDLVDKLLFQSGSAELSSQGVAVLSRLATVLARIQDRTILVSGHTDDTPIARKLLKRYPTNWELSSARAVNVVHFLSENGNVPPSSLVAAGHGSYQPIASNTDKEGRARNRRIEILLMPRVDVRPR